MKRTRGQTKTWRRKRSSIAKPMNPKKVYSKPYGTWKQSPNIGIGQALSTRMRTCWWSNITTGGTGKWTGNILLNSVFAPTGSVATGIQPIGYDQLLPIYNRYLVTGGYYKITFLRDTSYLAGTATTTRCFVASAYPSLSSVPVADYQDSASQPYAHTAIMPANGKCTFYRRFDMRQLWGAKNELESDEYGAAMNISPASSKPMYLNFFVQGNESAVQLLTVHIELVQDVYFDQKIPVFDV